MDKQPYCVDSKSSTAAQVQRDVVSVNDIEAGTTKANTITTEHEIIHKSIQTKSFVEHIKYIVELKSDTVFSTWYNEKGKAANNYTFQQLWDEAGHCAHLLRNKWGVKKDDRVVLCYDFGLHFFAMFLGCLRAGVTAVLVYPPGPPLVKSLTKMNKVIEDCAPAIILTQTSINLFRAADRANPASKSRAMWPSGVKYQVTDRIIRHDPFIADKTNGRNKQAKTGFFSSLVSGRSSSPPPSFDEPNIKGSDLAFLQYTSGSTGNPKGVMVTHNALRANIELVQSYWLESFKDQLGGASQVPERIATCSWLPQYHDMGLIEMGIAPLAGAYRSHMISPIAFIRNPLLWVDLMSQHRCHISAAPDFGYRLVTRKYNEAVESPKGKTNPIPKLDLSSVLHLQNAAEPIRLDTEKNFADAFCQYNLREDWFLAAYGLAENVVGVSYNHGFHLSTMRPDEDLQPFIAIAQRSNLHSSVDIIIVDPDTRVQRPDNVTGEIWVAGASVTAGYYNQPQLSKEAFQATLRVEGDSSSDADASADGKMYLRTGDYGFYQDDYLYICGRKKDIVIVNGVNYYPQDIEHAVEEASSAVRPGCVAAFSSNDSGDDGQLEIVFEIRASHAKDAETVCQQVRRNVISQIGLTPATVAAVEERSISKTTSGKIQRRQNRQRLHEGTQKMVLDVIGKSNFFSSHGSNLASQSKRFSMRKSIIENVNIEEMDFYDLVESCTGTEVNPDDEWKDVGLSSMMELELRQSLSERYNTTLPANIIQLFPRVMDLKTFLEASKGEPLPTNLPTLKRILSIPNEKFLSQSTVAIIQAIGVLVAVLIFSLPIVPAYEVGKSIAGSDVLSGHEWVLLPLIVPVWAIALTFMVILSKWIVIGKYTEGYVNQTNIYFIRWWFVDRLVHLWENFVGRFIVGTPLMTLFCYLMGADVHRSCNISSFIREFDLAKVDANALVCKPIRCRMFGPWKDEEGPSLRFRKIQVGPNAMIMGILSPGVKVGSNCHVQHISVLAEGAQAPSSTVIRGNPGYIKSTTFATAKATSSQNSNSVSVDRGDSDSYRNGDDPQQAVASTEIDIDESAMSRNDARWIILGGMKMTWLLVEIYITFCCFLISNILVRDHLPDWRYSKLQYWIISIGLTSVLLMISSIMLKWVMIGKKRPGKARAGILSEFTDWACDYHFNLACLMLDGPTHNSIIWTLVQMAHGLDIDLRSKVFCDSFHPSKVDLITIRRSFVSKVSFHIEEDGQYKAIKVEDSSIGFNVVCGPGATVRNALVSPATYIATDLIHEQRHPSNRSLTNCELIQITFLSTILYIAMIIMIAASFVPAFELWMHAIKPQTPLSAVPVVVTCVIIHTVVWLILLRAVETVALAGSSNRTEPWCIPLYMVYQSLCYWIQIWSFASLLWGTAMMNAVLRFKGADVQGRLLYFGSCVCETALVTFSDGSVVDESSIAGHYGEFLTLTLGKCFIDGVMHQQAFALARREPTQPGGSLIEHRPGKMVGDDQASCKGQLRLPPILALVEEGRGSTDPGTALDRCSMQDLDTTAQS